MSTKVRRVRWGVMNACIRLAFLMDALRLWPRIYLCLYFAGGGMILDWYLRQDQLAWDRSGFVAVYASLGLPLMKWYMENGVDWATMLPMVFKRYRQLDKTLEKADEVKTNEPT